MAKLNHQDLKDGLILQRAMSKVGANEVYTLKTIHVSQNGKVLCGFKGQLYNRTVNMDIAKFPHCQVCANKFRRLLDNQVKAELRNYWRNPDHKGALAPKGVKPVKKVKTPDVARPMLPDELLPTGSGKGKGLW
jgi:hypothetical protein